MDFKKELVKELGLGAIAEDTMLDDYVKACEAIAIRYHDHKVKTLGLFSVMPRLYYVVIDKDGAFERITDGLPYDRANQILTSPAYTSKFKDMFLVASLNEA